MTPRIYIAYTGGTFGMKPTPSGFVPDRGLAQALQARLPAPGQDGMPHWELHEYAQLIDSAEAQPRDWHTIATDIAARYDAYDGFVVIHGTDTMAYTASALSFALVGLRKPVIVTGAQIPLAMPRSDAPGNLAGALLIAGQHPLPEVGLYFGGQLLRGNRATKVSAADFDAFASPNHPPLGRVGIDVEIDRRRVLPMPAQEAFQVVAPQTREVAMLRLYPGLTVALLERVLAPGVAGLVLQSYGAGNGPVGLPGFVDTLAAASARGVVIVNVSQCARGRVDPALYATGSALAAAGVVGGLDMTVEAALTKLHHLLSLGLGAEEARHRLQQPCCGELTSP
ncbi:asparaginase [Piscinibacter sp.]|uniref:asparaginase n=1 Tax=Piscinibacter sp. TaxID=1903157 RepID=UPI002C719D48|nr:asparaginase [Albitalea sp.]HUG21515.1 asparaginase [Albitalea sp.]